jgi:hypothetical protein
VDNVTAEQYEENLDKDRSDLLERFKIEDGHALRAVKDAVKSMKNIDEVKNVIEGLREETTSDEQ